jgi:AraC-like DNA-binding protein
MRHAADISLMEYRELSPPPQLSHLARCCWTLEGAATDAAADPVFPDGRPEIIWNLGEPIRARRPDGVVEQQPPLMLVGQITAPFVVQPTGVVRLFGIRLEPFGAAPFCANMSAITDSWLDLERRLFGVTAQSFNAASSPHVPRNQTLALAGEQLIDALVQTLRARREQDDLPHPAVIAACTTIRDGRGNVSLEQLSADLDITLRSLQRRFAAEVGIPPKLLARITRFQHVFSAWREDPRRLAAVAADCGYFDQSHLVRDFRDFAGDAPAAALTEQAAFTSFFLP